MTIIYLGEMTLEASDLADLLRDDDKHYVAFASSAFEIEQWAENDEDKIVVIHEMAYADEARKLDGRFALIERKAAMSYREIFDALDLASK
jgi:hypothetical protein